MLNLLFRSQLYCLVNLLTRQLPAGRQASFFVIESLFTRSKRLNSNVIIITQ